MLQKLTEGTADQNQFAAGLRSDFFLTRAGRIAQLLKSLGPLSKVQLVERSDNDGDRVYGYELLFQNGQRFFRLVLSDENKITGIAFVDDF